MLEATCLAVSIAVVAAAVYLGLPWLYMRLLRRRLVLECRASRCIAITFDDGPCPRLTARIRELLAAAGQPATFFLVGRSLPGNERLVAQLVRDGHEVGSHGMQHLHHWRSTPWRAMADTQAGLAVLAPLRRPQAAAISFRPPHGKLNLATLMQLRWRGVPVVPWTHDGGDARRCVDRSPEALVSALRESGGGVLLLHDYPRDATGEDLVLARLAAVLALLHEGFRFVRVHQILDRVPATADGVIPTFARR